jgi:death-on-curing protein
MMGQPLISDPVEIAAGYLFYLCRNHAFIDGNKRTALAVCLVFLESNNLLPSTKLSADEWEGFVLDVAASRLDRDQSTQRLRTAVATAPAHTEATRLRVSYGVAGFFSKSDRYAS